MRPFHSALVLMDSHIWLRPLVTIACAERLPNRAWRCGKVDCACLLKRLARLPYGNFRGPG